MNLLSLLVSAVVVSIGAVPKLSVSTTTRCSHLHAENAAIRFKPTLRIFDACRPYPAVNAAGETSAGLKGSGLPSVGCEGSSLGSQVYGRAISYRDLWAIMYALYFPKDKSYNIFKKGQRHDWMNAVVWINNPALESPTLIGVSPWSYRETEMYTKYTPPPLIASTAQPIVYEDFHYLNLTWGVGGEFRDLIMWEQLTDKARQALNETDFGTHAPVPFIDANFLANLEKAWPY